MSAAASSSSGRIPQGEVIMDFADGGSYIKHKLENAVMELEKRRVTKEEGQKAQRAMEALGVGQVGAVRSEDVDLVAQQLDCSQDVATDALKAEQGDVRRTLIRLAAS